MSLMAYSRLLAPDDGRTACSKHKERYLAGRQDGCKREQT